MKKFHLVVLTILSVFLSVGIIPKVANATTVGGEPRIMAENVLDYYYQNNKQLITTGAVSVGTPYGHVYKVINFQNGYTSSKNTRIISETVSGLYRTVKLQMDYTYDLY